MLPRLIGVRAAVRLLFSGEIISAEHADELGYPAAVVEPDELEVAARAEALRFTAGSPFAIRETKALLYAGIGRSFDDHLVDNRGVLERCFRSGDHREGVACFLETLPAELHRPLTRGGATVGVDGTRRRLVTQFNVLDQPFGLAVADALRQARCPRTPDATVGAPTGSGVSVSTPGEVS